MGGKSSQPASPDYNAAAQATASANKTNINTPYGGLKYSPGENGTWNADVTLSPDQQRLQDQQTNTSLQLGGLQGQASNRVGQSLSTPWDSNAYAKAPVNAGTTGQDAMMARLQPQFDKDQAAMNNRLANQGIMPGSEAYNNEQDTFNRGKNDAYSQAALQGINLDTNAHQQGMQEQSFLRSQPLNELNSLRTGSQVQGPQFNQVPQTPGANYLGAAQLYGNDAMGNANASNASNSNMMSGLFGVASQMPWGQWFSDRRLKRNVRQIGKRPDGLNVYAYTYVWGQPAVGVMADEVKTLYPHAVTRHASGFDMVDYSKLGG